MTILNGIDEKEPGLTVDQDRPVYLDHHATTPTDPAVVEAMLPYFTERFGNPSNVSNRFGWEATDAVEQARAEVAALIGADPEEILFTSGATESNNLAIKGILRGDRRPDRHLITTATEHHAVLNPVRRLAREEGVRQTILSVDRFGAVDPDDIAAAITPETVLVSVIWANNEIGTINPIEEIAEACRERGIAFHTDAAQAAGKVPINLKETPVDLLSLTGHKFHGPKGIGALFRRRGKPRIALKPLVDGGKQESGLRSGTLPVPLIVGLGKAAELANRRLELETKRFQMLRDRLEGRIRDGLAPLVVRRNGDPEHCLPNNLHLSFPGVDGSVLLIRLVGLAVSSGAACSTSNPSPSHVLRAIGLDEELALASLRFGIGRTTTEAEVDQAASIVIRSIRALRGKAPSV